jgi:hypothetical protein
VRYQAALLSDLGWVPVYVAIRWFRPFPGGLAGPLADSLSLAENRVMWVCGAGGIRVWVVAKKSGGVSLYSSHIGAIVCCQFAL